MRAVRSSASQKDAHPLHRGRVFLVDALRNVLRLFGYHVYRDGHVASVSAFRRLLIETPESTLSAMTDKRKLKILRILADVQLDVCQPGGKDLSAFQEAK